MRSPQQQLGVKDWTIIFNALRNSPTSKITTWNLSSEHLGPKIAKPLAEYISVSASVTSVRSPAYSRTMPALRPVPLPTPS